MGYRRTRKHKSRKSKSRRYRRQRGGDEQPVTTETNITGTIDEYLNEANELIGTVKKETETTVSDLFNSIGSVFSSNSSQSTTPQPSQSSQTAGRKRRRRKHKRTHRK